MREIQPRITGTEVEWVISLRHYDEENYTKLDTQDLYPIVKVVTGKNSVSSFMANGARCYVDMNHLEYATGEDDSFMGTVANEIAGEQLVHEAIAAYVKSQDDIEDYELLKRIQIPHERKCENGYHINLCGDATAFKLNEHDLYDLGLWAATASIYTGAGMVTGENKTRTNEFAIAQKSRLAKTGLYYSFSARPLVLLRDEPLADENRFHRVQISGIDQNTSPWAMRMAIGTASLCLRAIEQNRTTGFNLKQGVDQPRFDPLAQLARDVAYSSGETEVVLDNGRTMEALDVQYELLAAAEKTDHTDEEAEILENWKLALEDEGRGADIKVGHINRRRLIEAHGAEDIAMYDRTIDSMAAHGIAETLRATIWKDDMPSVELIAERRNNPCPTTRAALRGAGIHSREALNITGVGWNELRETRGNYYSLNDPYMTKLPEMTKRDFDIDKAIQPYSFPSYRP